MAVGTYEKNGTTYAVQIFLGWYMKPIVIYPTSKDNKISLTKQEFEDYLKQAYDSGHADGYSAGRAAVN